MQYAAPPTGPLRWRQPVPIEESGISLPKGLLDASSPGPTCVQTSPAWPTFLEHLEAFLNKSVLSPTSTLTAGEDCLQLDVIMSTFPKSMQLPVIIQIYGGGQCEHQETGLSMQSY